MVCFDLGTPCLLMVQQRCAPAAAPSASLSGWARIWSSSDALGSAAKHLLRAKAAKFHLLLSCQQCGGACTQAAAP